MFTYVKNNYNLEPNWVLENTNKNKKFIEIDIEFDVAPFLELPETLENFRKMHKSKFWYNIKRSEKKFNEEIGELEFIVTSDKDLLKKYLPKIQTLFSKRWEQTYSSFDWKTKEGFKKYYDAMLDLAEDGNGNIAVLVHNDEVLSFAYNLIYNNSLYFFQHAVSPDTKYRRYSLGKVMIKKLIDHSIYKKYEIFDFMTGNKGYKKEWSTNSKKIFIRISEKKTIIGFNKFVFKYIFYNIKKFIHRNERIKNILKLIINFRTKL